MRLLLATLFTAVLAYDPTLGFNRALVVENRTIDDIYKAALAEGGVVNVWHGGDESGQQAELKQAFEARFPNMTLNVTVDLSKYHDGNIDRQLATDSLYIDSAILQTLHDFTRWDLEGALLGYQPLDFYKIHPAFRHIHASWYGVRLFGWSNVWNSDRLADGPKEFTDYLKPEFKDKLVLTYPNDDDAVLFAFDLIMQQYGYEWFEALLAQNPHWVRGTATPVTLLLQENTSFVASFTTSVGLAPSSPLNVSIPSEGNFVSWPQTAGIFRDAPHPEGAKLLHNFMLSDEFQGAPGSWSVRKDMPAPAGYDAIMDVQSTNPVEFSRFMGNRERVERLRFFFESKIGSAQGLSPLIDNL
ncbi:hypothetical protein JX265_010010 [Neoarthrinium moseri]|uniref:ABC transporter n=1 Tax=Neoarthrinium moseri TaxID=1658444 RepID=A0A9P9WEI0_9PEZI|nr:hypothetical protein JX265_010010 [Neoarthrinium moseri]